MQPDLFGTPDPERLPTAKPFLGRAIVVRFDEATNESPTFVSDIVFMRRLGVHPIIVHDALERAAAARLVGHINRIGGSAVGLDGLSAGTLTAARTDEGAAALHSVNTELLDLLLERGYIPVLASEGAAISGDRAPLDVDDTARGLAAAVGAIRLLFNARPGGISSDGEGIIPELTSSEALALAGSGALPRDLAHHLAAAALGVRAGVGAAQILDLAGAHASLVELLTAQHLGTQVVSNVLLS